MPIKSFELISIDAKRFSKLGEKIPHIRVDHNASVTSLTALSDKEAQVDFRFTVNYSGVGVIKFEGRVVWDGEANPLASNWAQTSAIPKEVFGPILAAIYANCIPCAIVYARDLGLPPPIPPMQVPSGKPMKSPDGKETRSMEVA